MSHISKAILAILLIIMTFALGCGEKLPIKEMVLAYKAIKKAYTVKADKYAKKEIDTAEKLLISSHDLSIKKELKKAKTSAVDSKKKAEEAYNKAVVLLAKDTMKVAKSSIDAAKETYAEHLAKDTLADAEKLYSKANKQFQSKKYYNSYVTALEADKKAKEARNNSIAKKDILKKSIDQVKSTLAKSKKYNVDKHAAAKLKKAEENVKIAEDAYTNLKLKLGFSAIQVAKINADEALINSFEGTAKEKITKAEAAVKKAEDSEGSQVAKDEMTAAKESLKNAKSYLAQSKYNESISSSDEAVRLATIVAGTKKPVIIAKNDGKKDGNKNIPDDNMNVNIGYDSKNFHLYKVKSYKKHYDCLWNIAWRYYKDPKKWKIIYNVNKKKIQNPDVIIPGWILKVPKKK